METLQSVPSLSTQETMNRRPEDVNYENIENKNAAPLVVQRTKLKYLNLENSEIFC